MSTEAVLDTCRAAREAARTLATASRATKDAALLAIADALEGAAADIVAANEVDLQRGRAEGLTEGLLDRLRLTEARVAAVAAAVRDVAALPDPVGEVVRGSTLPNGLRLRQLRVPMGVVAMVYEARPNVTVDAAVLALKSGNAAVLRGGSAALSSNLLLVQVMRAALASAGLPADAISSVDEYGRDGVAALMTARGLVDLLIPRGGAGLIQAVVQNATVPVIETGTGNCHVYVDASADLEQAPGDHHELQDPADQRLQRGRDAARARRRGRHLPAQGVGRARGAGVRLHVDPATATLAEAAGIAVTAAGDDDWAREYLDLDLAVAVVADLDEAVAHIRRWSSGHTEAIVTTDLRAADRFTAEVDSAVVAVNASTAFPPTARSSDWGQR